jgi:integrase
MFDYVHYEQLAHRRISQNLLECSHFCSHFWGAWLPFSAAQARLFGSPPIAPPMDSGLKNRRSKRIAQKPRVSSYIQTNPCIAVDLLKDTADTTRDVFTPEQVAMLLNVAEGDWKGVILAGYYTGLRLRDITELRWESIDFDPGVIRVRTSKTGKGVAIPIHPDLTTWLLSQTRGVGKAPVFTSLAEQSGTGRSGLSMQFHGIMDAAGIKGRVLRERKKGGKGRQQNSLTFHSLRHSFVSALANAGVAAELRQKLAGHSDQKSHARYTHHEAETLRAAILMLPGIQSLKSS